MFFNITQTFTCNIKLLGTSGAILCQARSDSLNKLTLKQLKTNLLSGQHAHSTYGLDLIFGAMAEEPGLDDAREALSLVLPY